MFSFPRPKPVVRLSRVLHDTQEQQRQKMVFAMRSVARGNVLLQSGQVMTQEDYDQMRHQLLQK